MPPKGPKAAPKVAAKKGPPPAMLAKMKAQIQAQKDYEDRIKREEEEEEARIRAEERLAEEQRKIDEEDKKKVKEEHKVQEKLHKGDKKKNAQLAALERMRAAGLIVPDVPKDKEKQKGAAFHEPKPKPKVKHFDPQAEKRKKDEEAAKAAAAAKDGEDEELLDDWELELEAEEKRNEDQEKQAKEEDGARKKAEADAAASEIDKYAPENMFDGTNQGSFRSPICCVLGHVDTGKTSLLDKIRRTNVQGGEAGGITQQIGATFFPKENIIAATEDLNKKYKYDMKVPGLLVIDTPGHESFTNLRSRGSSLCDIAVLVVDIMHGLEPQTKESLTLLKQRKCPFIVALNKVDRLYDWQPHAGMDIEQTLSLQAKHTLMEYETRVKDILLEFSEQGFNAELYYKNTDAKRYVSVVPTSAHSGEGIADLLLLEVQLVQRYMEDKISYKDDLQCIVLEVKPTHGFGNTIDVVLVNGIIKEGMKIVVCGLNGAIVTTIKSLLTPQPMKELRVKSEFVHHKQVRAALGVKIAAPDLEDAVPGTPMFVVEKDSELAKLKKEVMKDLSSILEHVDKSGIGVAVQSSTLGAMEALLSFLQECKIPVAIISLGPIHKKHIIPVIAMRERNPKFGVMLAFDVAVSKDAAEIADKNNVRIFAAPIIYHLFDMFTKYVESFDNEVKERNRNIAVFPVEMKIVQKVRAKDPIILGCSITQGQLHVGTPLCVIKTRTKENSEGKTVTSSEKVFIGRVIGIEKDKKELKTLRVGNEAAVKIQPQDAKFEVGRQFEETDTLYSAISRESINALKESFREEMDDADWELVIKCKQTQRVL